MAANPLIPHVPHPKQQQFLLHTHAREVLYGGAAGGGKSDALLMAAAQFCHVPGYSALLLRETFRDLNQPDALIPRSKEWWSGLGAWSGQDKRWTFRCPGGGTSTVTFGYLEHDDDVYQYQGAAFQFIGTDELTQHTEFRYRYLFSRLRNPESGPLAEVPLRMRAGSNPGGKGHEWVKTRFLKGGSPGAVFVPAKLADNPSLNRDEYVSALQHLDPLTREQLLAGDWDAVASGRCKREWLRHYTRTPAGWYNVAGRHYGPEQVTGRFLTVDPAATVKTTAKPDPDYTVISAWGTSPAHHLLWLGCKRLRVEVPDIADVVAEEYARHGAGRAYVEGVAGFKGVVQLCQRHPARMNVIGFVPEGDKLTNAANALNLAEAGRLWLPRDDPAFPLDEVESELLRFTGDPKQDGHDDVVDTLAKAANLVCERSPAPPRKPVVAPLAAGFARGLPGRV